MASLTSSCKLNPDGRTATIAAPPQIEKKDTSFSPVLGRFVEVVDVKREESLAKESKLYSQNGVLVTAAKMLNTFSRALFWGGCAVIIAAVVVGAVAASHGTLLPLLLAAIAMIIGSPCLSLMTEHSDSPLHPVQIIRKGDQADYLRAQALGVRTELESLQGNLREAKRQLQRIGVLDVWAKPDAQILQMLPALAYYNYSERASSNYAMKAQREENTVKSEPRSNGCFSSFFPYLNRDELVKPQTRALWSLQNSYQAKAEAAYAYATLRHPGIAPFESFARLHPLTERDLKKEFPYQYITFHDASKSPVILISPREEVSTQELAEELLKGSSAPKETWEVDDSILVW